MSNLAIYRLLIALIVILHVWFFVGGFGTYLELQPIQPWEEVLWYISHGVLAISLVGLALMYKSCRYLLVLSIALGLFQVWLQGPTGYEELGNVLVQVNCGIYGAVLAMSYFYELPWKNAT